MVSSRAFTPFAFYFLTQVLIRLSVAQTYNSWSPTGCWVDSAPRTLHHIVGGSDTNTVENCLDTCASLGYALGGVEYGHECYCGNARLYDYGSSENCNMACSGNASQTCGGPDAIDIFSYAGASYTYGPAALLKSYKNWVITECWEDNGGKFQGPRLLPHWPTVSIPAEEMTVEKCLDGCGASGYTSAGLEWGQECWCGNVTYPPGESTSVEECNMPCLDNAQEYCGGSQRILVYTTLPFQSLL